MALLRRITLIATSVAVLSGGAVASASSAAASGIPAPTLVSPANSTTAPLKNVILRWRPVAGASKYEVQVSPNVDWTNNKVELPDKGRTVANLLELPVSLPHATYFWRVRARAGGAWGPFSAPRQFFREWDAPLTVLQQPTAINPTISWAPVPDASVYRVEFFETPPQFPDDTPSTECATAETSYTPHALSGTPPQLPLDASISAVPWPQSDNPCELQSDTTYYYRVTAYDDSNADLVVADTAPNEPTGSFPTPPTGPSACYQLPECDAGTFVAAGGPFTYTESAPSGSASATTGGAVTGLKTTWHTSTSTPITCDATTPCPITPTFSWDPVPNAGCYVVTVYRDAAATNTYWKYSTPWTTLTPQDSYLDAQPGRPYYWRVQAGRAQDGCLNQAVATCTASQPGATVVAPTVTSLSASPAGPTGPTSARGGQSTTVTLTGTGFQTGACVGSSAGGVTNTAVTSPTQIRFTYTAPVDGGPVTFTVTNPDGGVSTSSPTLKVSPDVIATSGISSFDKRSAPVTLRSPRNGATEHGRTLTFDWNDLLSAGSRGSYDARNYDLQISRTADFDTPLKDINNLDLTQYTDAKGSLGSGHYFWRVAAIDESGDILTWSQPREVTLNSGGPTVHFGSKAGLAVGKQIKINFSDLVKGVNRHTVKVVPAGKPRSAALRGSISLGAGPTRYVFTPRTPLATGGTYHLVVSRKIVDANGSHVVVTGKALRTKLVAPDHSPGWRYSSGWSRQAASGAISGSYAIASAGHSAKLHLAGNDVQITGCKGPGMGTIAISVAGKIHRVSEAQSFTRCGVVLWHRALPAGIHTLRVHVTHGVGNFDAVTVT